MLAFFVAMHSGAYTGSVLNFALVYCLDTLILSRDVAGTVAVSKINHLLTWRLLLSEATQRGRSLAATMPVECCWVCK